MPVSRPHLQILASGGRADCISSARASMSCETSKDDNVMTDSREAKNPNWPNTLDTQGLRFANTSGTLNSRSSLELAVQAVATRASSRSHYSKEEHNLACPQTGVLAIAAQRQILHTVRTDTQNRKGYNVQTDANTHNTD
eukprot:5441578-Amphidinium_carterae.2